MKYFLLLFTITCFFSCRKELNKPDNSAIIGAMESDGIVMGNLYFIGDAPTWQSFGINCDTLSMWASDTINNIKYRGNPPLFQWNNRITIDNTGRFIVK